jgi:GIY-YIG catalytic domain-containing protein
MLALRVVVPLRMSMKPATTKWGPDEVAAALRQSLWTIPNAVREPSAGGLPDQHGVYAWWVSPESIPGVNGPAHPDEPFELLYVGIAPKDADSKATLRSRVRGQHLGGNIGSSTFRQSLAALLLDAEGWTTHRSGSRCQLRPEHNRALSKWQREHLRITWVPRPNPWEVEVSVIATMKPPLNLAGNASHPLHARLKELRAKLRGSASAADAEEAPVRHPQAIESEARDSARVTSDSALQGGTLGQRRTQRVTAKDVEVGQIRVPRGPTKSVFPRERQHISVRLRGRELTCRWDPRYGPPERSGVIRVGKAAARELLDLEDVLAVRIRGGQVELD